MIKKGFCLFLFLFVFLTLVISQRGIAQEVPLKSQHDAWQLNIPSELQPWVKWVSKDFKIKQCPFGYNDFKTRICYWPTLLNVEITGRSLSFKMQVFNYEASFVQVVGEKNYWPEKLLIDAEEKLIIQKEGKPYVWLAKGAHSIEGQINISSELVEISVPNGVALIKLKKDKQQETIGSVINNKLQIKDKLKDINFSQKQDENKIKVEVFRKLEDGLPFIVNTYLHIAVTGVERKINLGQIIPVNSKAYSFKSDLPVRTERNGDFVFYVKSGEWNFQIESYFSDVVSELNFTKSSPDMPNYEYWSYVFNNSLREVSLSGLKGIDPSQLVNFPAEWRSYRTFLANEGEKFHIKELSWTPKMSKQNNLRMDREAWLNYDGSGYIFKDSLNGYRDNADLDFLESNLDFDLLHASINQNDVPILTSPTSGKKGVHLNQQQVDVKSEGVIVGKEKFSLSSWLVELKSCHLKLHLPYGWSIFYMSGGDFKTGWYGTWDLVEIFYFCLVLMLFAKFHTKKITALVFIVMLLVHNRFELYWWFIFEVFLFILVKAFQNQTEKKYRVANYLYKAIVIGFACAVFCYSFKDIRFSLYPQLQKSYFNQIQTSKMGQPPFELSSLAVRPLEKRKLLATSISPANDMSFVHDEEFIPKYTEVSTGVGLPKWNEQVFNFDFYSSIDVNEKLSLIYISPNMNILLAVLRLLSLFFLSFLLLQISIKELCKKIKTFGLIASVVCLVVPNVEAEVPDRDTLNELRNYVVSNLDKEPSCLPNCASLQSLHYGVEANQVVLDFDVHALNDVTLPILKLDETFLFDSLAIDEVKFPRAIKNEKNDLVLFVTKGKHHVTLKLELLDVQMVRLQFAQAFTSLKSGLVIGAEVTSNPSNQELLIRRLADYSTKKQVKQRSFQTDVVLNSYFQVTREITLGRECRVKTYVHRIGNISKASYYELPLIKGEHIVSSQTVVKDGVLRINFLAGEYQKDFKSTLPLTRELNLKAQNDGLTFERWNIQTDYNLQVKYNWSYAGKIINKKTEASIFLPRPNEVLTIKLTEFQSAPVIKHTIVSSLVRYNLEKKGYKCYLTFTIRAALAGRYEITLPLDAELELVSIDGKSQPLNIKNGKVGLELLAKEQSVAVHFRAKNTEKFKFNAPKIDLATKSLNSITKYNLDNNKWLVFLKWTPRGPVLLFWSALPFVLFLAIILRLSGRFPVKLYEWCLLFLGFGLTAPLGILVIAIWFFIAFSKIQFAKKCLKKEFLAAALFAFIVASVFNKLALAFFIFVILAFLTAVPLNYYFLILTLGLLYIIFIALQNGLMGIPPDMGLTQVVSSGVLSWYQDRVTQFLPQPTVYFLDLFYYKVAMIVWSLWFVLFSIKIVKQLRAYCCGRMQDGNTKSMIKD